MVKRERESTHVEEVSFSSAVGSLMYTQVCTRPNVVLVVNYLGRYLSSPVVIYLKVVKEVIMYLLVTNVYVLILMKFDQLQVIGYSEFYFTGYQDKKKSNFGLVFITIEGVIYWKSA